MFKDLISKIPYIAILNLVYGIDLNNFLFKITKKFLTKINLQVQKNVDKTTNFNH